MVYVVKFSAEETFHFFHWLVVAVGAHTTKTGLETTNISSENFPQSPTFVVFEFSI
jgi:hypothetical protein